MRITKKTAAFLLALLVVLSPVTVLPLTTAGFATPEVSLQTAVDQSEILPGETLTVTVSLDREINSRGFGLEYSFDENAFEWVRGEWSDAIKDDVALIAANETAAVFAKVNEFSVSDEIFTLTLKCTAAAVCTEAYEIAISTGELLPAVPATATVTVQHRFDDACDETCNACLEKVRDAKHVYDNPADASCNACSAVRELPTYVHATRRGDTVTVSVSLAEKIEIQGFGLDFLNAYDRNAFEWVSGDWSREVKSLALLIATNPDSEAVFAAEQPVSVFGEVFSFVLKVKDTAAFGDYDVAVGIAKADGARLSTTAITVHECTATSEFVHDENIHWNVCATYACENHLNEAAHEYTNACDSDCNVCGRTRVAHHDYTVSSYDTDSHWKTCALCGKKDESSVKPHTFDNAHDSKCDACGYTKYILGDVNGDKSLDLNDAIHLLYYVNFPTSYDVNQPVDFDGSGEVDLNDAIYLLYHIIFQDVYPLH